MLFLQDISPSDVITLTGMEKIGVTSLLILIVYYFYQRVNRQDAELEKLREKYDSKLEELREKYDAKLEEFSEKLFSQTGDLGKIITENSNALKAVSKIMEENERRKS